MKNSLCDLNDHLFTMLEGVINTDDDNTEEIENMCKKAKTVTELAKTIINNATVELEAMKFMDVTACKRENVPEMLLPKNTSKGTIVKLIGDEI